MLLLPKNTITIGNIFIGHPQTGRKALYVNSAYVSHIVELPKKESAALLAFDPQFLTPVREFIGEVGISEVRGPRYLRDKPFEQALLTLEKDLTTLRQKRAELAQRKDCFYAEKGPELMALRNVCFNAFSRN